MSVITTARPTDLRALPVVGLAVRIIKNSGRNA